MINHRIMKAALFIFIFFLSNQIKAQNCDSIFCLRYKIYNHKDYLSIVVKRKNISSKDTIITPSRNSKRRILTYYPLASDTLPLFEINHAKKTFDCYNNNFCFVDGKISDKIDHNFDFILPKKSKKFKYSISKEYIKMCKNYFIVIQYDIVKNNDISHLYSINAQSYLFNPYKAKGTFRIDLTKYMEK